MSSTEVEKKQVWLTDVAIPGDNIIQQEEVEKSTKYQNLKIEVERLWEKKASVVPVVIGAPGAILKDLEKHPKPWDLTRYHQANSKKQHC